MNGNLGRNIARLRKQFNMTQTQLAEKLCVTYQTVSNWERGVSFPDVDSIGELCLIFSISSDELFGIKVKQHVPQNKTKSKPKILYYDEKIKSAKILPILLCVLVVSFLITKIISSGIIKYSIFVSFLYLMFAPIFVFSFIFSVILFFVSKVYVENKTYIILFIIFISCSLILTIIGVSSIFDTILSFTDIINDMVQIEKFIQNIRAGNALVIIGNICYYVSNVFLYLSFVNKNSDDINSKWLIIYFASIIIDAVFIFVFNYSLSLFVISFILLCLIKRNKTVQVPYYADNGLGCDVDLIEFDSENGLDRYNVQEMMPSSSTGIVCGDRKINSVNDDYEPAKFNFSWSDLFSGGKLTVVLFVIISVVVIFSLSTALFSMLDIVILLGVLPTLFYCLCFLLKQGSNSIMLNVLVLCVKCASLTVQNFIFMENLSLNYFESYFSIITVIINFLCVLYFVLFYKRRETVKFLHKIITLIANFILTSIFFTIALVDSDIKLGMLFIILVINMLTVFISSLSCFNKWEK